VYDRGGGVHVRSTRGMVIGARATLDVAGKMPLVERSKRSSARTAKRAEQPVGRTIGACLVIVRSRTAQSRNGSVACVAQRVGAAEIQAARRASAGGGTARRVIELGDAMSGIRASSHRLKRYGRWSTFSTRRRSESRAVLGDRRVDGGGGVGYLSWYAGVIQLVECQLPKLDVAGSSPVARSLSHCEIRVYENRLPASAADFACPNGPQNGPRASRAWGPLVFDRRTSSM
jgi:hypothetical protein